MHLEQKDETLRRKWFLSFFPQVSQGLSVDIENHTSWLIALEIKSLFTVDDH